MCNARRSREVCTQMRADLHFLFLLPSSVAFSLSADAFTNMHTSACTLMHACLNTCIHSHDCLGSTEAFQDFAKGSCVLFSFSGMNFLSASLFPFHLMRALNKRCLCLSHSICPGHRCRHHHPRSQRKP